MVAYCESSGLAVSPMEATRKCQCVRARKPSGPGSPGDRGMSETPLHCRDRDSRGIPAFKVCDVCKEHIQQGKQVPVTYKGHEVQVNADKGGDEREQVTQGRRGNGGMARIPDLKSHKCPSFLFCC